ncbi:MAG: PilN domain-containing protein [Deltaproteobacteria bacterium]
MIRVNLIPTPEKREVKGYGELLIGTCVIIALFAVIATLHILQNKKIEDLNTQIRVGENRIKELEVIKKKVDDFKAKNAELNRRIEIINVLEKNRTGPLYVMDALAGAIPNKAWIDEFSEKGQQAKLIGVADNEFTVADFMQALQISPFFKGVELGVIKKAEIRKQNLRSFVIDTRLDYAGNKKSPADEEEVDNQAQSP